MLLCKFWGMCKGAESLADDEFEAHNLVRFTLNIEKA